MSRQSNVNSEVKFESQVNTCLTVNCKRHLTREVNTKLSRQMKQVLLFLYRKKEYVHKQVDIIKSIYGIATPSRKASISRTIKALMKAGLVNSRKAYYSDQFQCWIRQRVCFYITEKGEDFVREKILEAE